jgi:hypothetical protein
MLKQSIAQMRERISYFRNYLINLAFKLGKWRYLPIFVILIIGITLPYLLGTVQVSYSIPNGGVIKEINVKVYNDSGCSISLPSIDWGLLEAGSSKNRTIYVKNNGNSPLMLTLSASNWIPSNAANYITLTWDYDGQPLNPNQFIKVVLMLVISPAIHGISSFTFDITVIGKG